MIEILILISNLLDIRFPLIPQINSHDIRCFKYLGGYLIYPDTRDLYFHGSAVAVYCSWYDCDTSHTALNELHSHSGDNPISLSCRQGMGRTGLHKKDLKIMM